MTEQQDRPTDEQAAVMDASKTGKNLVVQAGAGTGKTRTMRGAAYRMRGRGRYLTYNSAMAKAVQGKFPAWVRCSTIHSLAWGPVGAAYADRNRVPLGKGRGAPRQYGWQVAQILGLNRGITTCDQITVPAKRIGSLVTETLKQWCYTIDREISTEHVPEQRGLSDAGRAELAAFVVPLARKAWHDAMDLDGQTNVQHDFYLKAWYLSGQARMDDVDFWILDEGQDANQLAASILQQQRGQKIAVGDSAQAIYGWRGATDCLEKWPQADTLFLTQSFRFGPAVADWANQVLELIGAKIRLRGTSGIPSRVGPVDAPRAVLCRTNAGAVQLAIKALADGRKPSLAAGGGPIRDFARAAAELQQGRRTGHPDLAAFATWEDVRRYTEEPEGADLVTMVELVDEHGADELIDLVDSLSAERHADVTFSTVHGAKGLEWDTVAVGDDFKSPGFDEDGRRRPLGKSAGRVMYVAVTRPRLELNPGSLDWVPDWAGDRSVRRHRDRAGVGVDAAW